MYSTDSLEMEPMTKRQNTSKKTPTNYKISDTTTYNRVFNTLTFSTRIHIFDKIQFHRIQFINMTYFKNILCSICRISQYVNCVSSC